MKHPANERPPRAAATATVRRAKTGASASAATPETVAAKLLALPTTPPGEGGAKPALWRKTDLGRSLSRPERGHLDAALARLQRERRLVAFAHGGSDLFAFAEPLREWLAGGGGAPAAAGDHQLREVYRRLVRESGGFPDVKISLLARALGIPAGGGGLGGRLVALWRTGDATLSLGDWSLANAETRAAAVEMDGEKYLLVRFEE